MKNLFAICLVILSASPVAAQDSDAATLERAADLQLLDNGTVKVGIDRAKGASITWLSWSAYADNMVNIHDPGRLIQQSYYAGQRLDRRAEGQHKAWSPWPWNPIQGGGVGSWARVTEFRRLDDNVLFAQTIPKLWDMPNEEAAAIMRQWTGFEPGMPDVVVVRCELVSHRQPGDRWEPARRRHQEVPACYFTRNFNVFKSYLGDSAWRAVTSAPGPPWGKADPPRRAMACFAANGQGVAVFSPTAKSWNFGPFGKDNSTDPLGDPCVHIAPLDIVELQPRSTFRYRYWMVVGSETQIASRLDSLWEKYSTERAELTGP